MHNLQNLASEKGSTRNAQISESLQPGWAEALLDQIPGAVQLWEPMGSEPATFSFRLTYANRSAATLLAMPAGMVLNKADDLSEKIEACDTLLIFSLLSSVWQEGQAKAVPFATKPTSAA